ncbi:hypothetical protein [Nostoc sp. LEGE 12447]|uniref:hypothetical protein n=1 Tax=Nostoc sp. LEGE 12447 TaxID=1828640 RepID=UPI001D146D44|nr:hypothetical protein [Nostoc sp. LEGE 12447]
MAQAPAGGDRISQITKVATVVSSLISGCRMVLSNPCQSKEQRSYKGFPIGTNFPARRQRRGQLFGYSVPPSFATQLFISAQSKLLGVTV